MKLTYQNPNYCIKTYKFINSSKIIDIKNKMTKNIILKIEQ